MKVVDYSDKKQIKKLISNKKVVLVGGCFDILHFAHIKFLESAKKHGNFLVVALESDEFIQKRKQKKPFHNIDERAHILSSISFIDLIIKLPFFKKNKDYFALVELIKPNIIAVSDKDPYLEQKKKQIKLFKGQVKTVCPVIKKFSSTKAIPYASISCN
jgi:cytidyltransferase-like protein